MDDQDDVIFAPYTTVQKKLTGQQNVQQITLSAANGPLEECVLGGRMRLYAAGRGTASPIGDLEKILGAFACDNACVPRLSCQMATAK
jgi:hypothetical protein